MKKFIRTFYCFIVMLLSAAGLRAQEGYSDRARKYVETYCKMAMEEQRRSGVPAAITLGQGILETEAGISELVTQANNHFGIKCKSDWVGDKFLHTDDAPNECFKRYSCAAESYKDHSDYLHRNRRYARLFTLKTTDYKRWAVCLRQCGYATNPQYAQQLIKIIENFNLQSFTVSALDSSLLDQSVTPVMANEEEEVETTPATAGNESAPAAVPPVAADGKVLTINGIKAIYVHSGESLKPYALKFKMSYAHLLDINDMSDGPLAFDSYIYLDKKKTLGVRATHIVKEGESLLMVSQMEGLQLKRLMAMNMLSDGEEPAPGATLYLQSATAHKPALWTEPMVAHQENAIVTDADTTRQDDDEIPTSKVASSPVDTAVIDAPAPVPAPAVAVTATVVPPPAVTTPVAAVPVPPPAVVPATATAPVAPPPAAAATVAPPSQGHTPPTVAAATTTVPETAQSSVPQPIANTPANTAPGQKHVIIVKAEEDAPPAPPVVNTHIQDSLAAEAEFSSLKASLDPVVYADDSQLLDNHVTTVVPKTTAKKPAENNIAQVNATGDKVPSAAKLYTVKKGDTAYSIAKRNNISLEELYEMNHITASGVKIGKVLRVQ